MQIEATIQRVVTMDTKGGGMGMLLTFGMDTDDETIMALIRNRGKMARVTFELLQQSLGIGDDPNAGIEPVTERVFEATAGDVVKAHVYQSTLSDGACDLCGHGVNHDAHADKAIAAEKLLAAT